MRRYQEVNIIVTVTPVTVDHLYHAIMPLHDSVCGIINPYIIVEQTLKPT